jgi:hypothetical protein
VCSISNQLYAALDWLVDQQERIERSLARRHLHEGTLVLYALSDQVNHFLAFLSHLSTSRPQLHSGSVAAVRLVA